MADTYESKMERRVKQGTAVKVGNKYYSKEPPPTIAQTRAASKLGMTAANIRTINANTVAQRASSVSESNLSLALQWLSSVRSEANLIAAEPLPARQIVTLGQKLKIAALRGWEAVAIATDTETKIIQAAQSLKVDAQQMVQNIARIQVALDPIRRNKQMEKAAVLKSTYAQAKGFSSDDPYEEMVATSRSELEWYSKTYGTEDPIRIEALKTLERRDNQGKTSYELALEGKAVSAENVDALIAEIDETALADQVTLALQEEQKQAELARQASERRNKILLYFSGSVGIAILLYRLIRR
jgi:hypothetical protein